MKGAMLLNLFEAVKGSVTPRQVAENYGLEVNRRGMTCCPFHTDDDPSMKLYDDHYYCFGCEEHGDVIDFMSKLCSLSQKEAAERLAQEFGIPYDHDKQVYSPQFRKGSIIRRIKAEQDKDKENKIFKVLTDYYKLLQSWKNEYAPDSQSDELNPLFVEALTKSEYIDDVLERLISGTKEEKAMIISDIERDVVKIEKTLKRYVHTPEKHEIIIEELN